MRLRLRASKPRAGPRLQRPWRQLQVKAPMPSLPSPVTGANEGKAFCPDPPFILLWFRRRVEVERGRTCRALPLRVFRVEESFLACCPAPQSAARRQAETAEPKSAPWAVAMRSGRCLLCAAWALCVRRASGPFAPSLSLSRPPSASGRRGKIETERRAGRSLLNAAAGTRA